jgi:MFS family permease
MLTERKVIVKAIFAVGGFVAVLAGLTLFWGHLVDRTREKALWIGLALMGIGLVACLLSR